MQDALLEVRYICLFLHLMAVHFDCFPSSHYGSIVEKLARTLTD